MPSRYGHDPREGNPDFVGPIPPSTLRENLSKQWDAHFAEQERVQAIRPGPEQAQLFTPTERAKEPGEMSMDEWVAHHGDAVIYHGTFREDWQDAPVTHAGPIDQASERLHMVETQLRNQPHLRAGYYHGGRVSEDDWFDTSDEPEGATQHTGRVHAVRMTQEPHPDIVSDEEANLAHFTHVYNKGAEPDQIPGSVVDSVQGVLNPDQLSFEDELPETPHSRALSEGHPLQYRNAVETGFNKPALYMGPGTPSVAIPRGSFSTWEREVAAHPHASELAKQYAQQRIANRTEGAVAFPEGHLTMNNQGPQPQLDAVETGKSPWLMTDAVTGESLKKPATNFNSSTRRTINSIQFETDDDDD